MHKRGGVLVGLVALLLLTFATQGMADSTPSFGWRNLKEGIRGVDVEELQKALNYLGYSTEADGIFGRETKEALIGFQRSVGITADGIAGAHTFRVLNDTLDTLKAQWYEVEWGDSLYILAKRYGATVETIMAANGLKRTTIKKGEKLLLPAGSTLSRIYIVQRGDTLSGIAKRFGVSLERLLGVNDLEDPEYLRIGQKLLIPQLLPSRYHYGLEGRAIAMSWPVTSRRITSNYGWRIHPIYGRKQFHGGIDIGVPEGTPVYASAPGRVKRSGWLDGFGYAVVIDHGYGITTWYGHLSRILVKEGESVFRGQQIAESGNTGISTGPHLDFRIKVGEETVDPMRWLP